jgi:hypothetical protein
MRTRREAFAQVEEIKPVSGWFTLEQYLHGGGTPIKQTTEEDNKE